MIRSITAVVTSAHHHHHSHEHYLTQWLLHFWLLFTLLVIAGSESGGGSSFSSSSSSQTSTDEVLATAEARGGLACSFPSRWTGHWFQSGVHHSITISSSSISSKGKCLEVDGEKYLVYHPRSDCYRCLVFSEKHSNVLQYKETFCIQERRSLPSICSTISGDANLYAMFRLDAEPIDCPLQGPFSFSYDRGHGECRYPESSLDSCTQPSRLLFNYQACPDVPRTESVEEELQCLAAWKEGSYRYFLGLIQYRHHASSFEDRFRCFAYEVISSSSSNGASGHTVANMRRGELLSSHHSGHMNHHHQQQQLYPQTLALGRSRPKSYHGVSMIPTTSNNGMTMASGFNSSGAGSPDSLIAAPPPEIVYRVEQSGDATCNGLSTMEGSRTMFLRKVQPPTTENCQFPSWVQTHPQWHTLDQSLAYEFDADRFRVTNHSTTNTPDNLVMTASCMQILEDEPGHRAAIVLHSRAACKIGYQCMVLYKRDADILEVQFGEWSRKHEEACPAYFDPSVQPYITLISSTPKRAQCPALGKFSFQLNRENLATLGSMTNNNNNNNLHHEEALCSANGTLRMGCSSLDSLHLEISSACHDRNQHQTASTTSTTPASSNSRQVTEYKCHGWWEEDGSTYLLATTLSSSSSSSSSKLRPKRHCFVLRDASLADAATTSQWMRFKESREGEMPLLRHSNGESGQQESGASFANSRQMFDGHEETRGAQEEQTSSAALFFFNSNNNNNHAAVGKTLQVFRFADSCRRNARVGREQGQLAFNATKTGHCLASSSSSSSVIFRGGGSAGRMSILMSKMIMGSVSGLPHLFGIESLCWILSSTLFLLR